MLFQQVGVSVGFQILAAHGGTLTAGLRTGFVESEPKARVSVLARAAQDHQLGAFSERSRN
ncbi:MAG: hypothetical protein JWM11_4478 [Planctomycetaceae bacterium]|nr:hypothetical protein [Planctomycetaceae bacterium]